ncbi:hypothetical protein [Dysgonomonas macrotermitis]|uniref:Chaperone of endosialidase n=1 Tax=Dysgonomonas macrotermitis TaxID=1346286 RepID=A0A1M5A0A6_9BACT|nr:hypothetical protein [Dysgonomonas macrotermitis]SHF23709.1 hypothetical protein SAMN05444362_104246 [Dysgonomonas macrotermitis]
MKKVIFLTILLLFTKFITAQDQTINGTLTLNPQLSGSYLQGMRIKEAPDKWSLVLFGAAGNTGTSTDSWLVGRSPKLNFVISRNSADGLNGLVINPSGNIGIGTESPAYKLDIAGDLRTRRLLLSSGILTLKDSDIFSYDSKNMFHYGLQWGWDSWDKEGFTLWQSGYAGIKMFTGGSLRFSISRFGNVGIGTDTPQNKLDVNGTIRAKEVKVETGWADFVFDKDYKLPTLQEVENHINEYKHLPDIPSEKEVKENGISLGEMQAKLLQKIEELTLYVIDLKKENQEQNNTIQSLKELIQTKTE